MQRQCVVNGEYINIPDDFSIEFTKPKPVIQPENLKNIKPADFKQNENASLYYLKPRKASSLHSQTIIKNKELLDEKGWLHRESKHKKTIIQTEPLSEGEKRRLYDGVTCSGQEIDLVDLSAVPIHTLSPPAEMKSLTLPFNKNTLITTDDPYFVKEIVEKKGNVYTQQITSKTDSSDLIEDIEFNKESFSFTHELKNVFMNLQKGKKVILYGDLSEELYDFLESLYAQFPTLTLSNSTDAQAVKGQLIIITKKPAFPVLLAQYNGSCANVSRDVLWSEYEKQLTEKNR